MKRKNNKISTQSLNLIDEDGETKISPSSIFESKKDNSVIHKKTNINNNLKRKVKKDIKNDEQITPNQEDVKPKRKYTKRNKNLTDETSIKEQKPNEAYQPENYLNSLSIFAMQYKSDWEPREKIQLNEANKILHTNYKTWTELSEHPELTKNIKFIDKFYEFLDWYTIGTKQQYDNKFFNKYKKRLYWIKLI